MKIIDIIMLPILILLLIIVGLLSSVLFIINGRPIFFKQQRIGRYGKPFNIYKFRTLPIDYDKIHGLNVDVSAKELTPFNRFLREQSIDELPQVINILRCEMSIVGPRPITYNSPKNFDDYTFWERKKFESLPGITGLAQINGRNSIPMRKRFAYDAAYKVLYRKYSLLIDLVILYKTVNVVFKRKGQYEQ